MTSGQQTTTYTVERVTKLDGNDIQRLEDIQRRSLSMLHGISAVDHVLKDHEVEAFSSDERLIKFVVRHEGDFVGVFAVSRRPSHGWEHLSDRFFEGYYPRAFDADKFIYLAGSFIAPEHQGKGAYTAVIQAVMDFVDEERIEVFSGDMAAVNYQWMKPMLQKAMMQRFGYCNWEDVDTHYFSTATFTHHDQVIDLREGSPLLDDD